MAELWVRSRMEKGYHEEKMGSLPRWIVHTSPQVSHLGKQTLATNARVAEGNGKQLCITLSGLAIKAGPTQSRLLTETHFKKVGDVYPHYVKRKAE
ncbi:hypothetical protein Nepgr_025365 [Nepenthes gracilis]|uniref:Uncharacterized protein n=1 Tax=Nepenthes gracilis TaxID=150966 RepID=A0AAD3T7J4_NEPGR|nr:hypothetical protein Nepgr_025365 [Nepenthes gracilis]